MKSYPQASRARGNVSPLAWAISQDDILRKFLTEQKISFSVKGDEMGNGPRTYTIVTHPRYLDEVEKHVIQFCEENGIKYTFYATEDGMHHYEFSRGVFMDTGKEHVVSQMIDIRDAKLQEDARKIREDFNNLKMMREELRGPTYIPSKTIPRPKNWYQKLKRKVGNLWDNVKSYNPKQLLAQKAALAAKEKELDECERRINNTRHDMLVLSGIINEDED